VIRIVLLLALLWQPAPDLHATWQGDSAVISWQQPHGIGLTCLYRYYGATWPAAVCYHDLPAGPMRVELPGALLHPAYKPVNGDRYVLEFNGVAMASATLGEAVVYRSYLPLTLTRAVPRDVVRLAVIRG
jgi:hypothetical protein